MNRQSKYVERAIYDSIERIKSLVRSRKAFIKMVTVCLFLMFLISKNFYDRMARETIPKDVLDAINEHVTVCMHYQYDKEEQDRQFKTQGWYLRENKLTPIKLTQYTAVYKYDLEAGPLVIKRVVFRPDVPTQEDVISDALRHRNIVTTHRTKRMKYQDSTIIWLVCEYMPIVISKANINGEEHIRLILKDVLKGLAYMHARNIAHLDIKIANIMGKKEKGVIRYKLIDMGYSRMLNYDTGGRVNKETFIPNKSFGTFPYKPPEIVNHSIHAIKSDIYCVGFVAWILSTGKTPFYDKGVKNYREFKEFVSAAEIKPKISPHTSLALRNFITSCMNADRNKRPSAEKLLTDDFIVFQSREI